MTPSDPTPAAIAIQVTSPRQLINSLDPSPFHARDLDKDAEEHIVGWARELPRSVPIAIRIHMPAAAALETDEVELRQTISTHFASAATACEQELRELLRLGRIQLAIGLVVLVACLAGGQFLIARFGSGPATQAAQQGLLILGWVANWRPIETFLYGWWPIIRRRRLYRRLANASVALALPES
jgi:hypothetical protein